MKFKRIVSLVLTCALVLSLSVTGALADSYTVVKGDSLWRIAARLLGSGTKWSTIYDANRDTIKDPNLIYVGQVLNVPGTETEEPPVEQPPVENPPVEEPPVTTSVVVDPSQPIAVEGGSITGTLTADGQIAMWKGIPYAAPPVDTLRWKAPQPVVAWSGVRACTEYGHSAMQRFQTAAAPYTAEFLINDFDGVSEDCLYLNVWSKAGSSDALRPVIFYIHGGGFTSGGGNCDIYDGELLARDDVVYVSINYRLGIFGFMVHPELTAESPTGTSGNYAVLDWIKALQWVHNYIAQFGGDPNNVTIVGQSAGAGAVNSLVGSPLARGLFVNAFAMSGGMGGVANRGISLEAAEEGGVALCEKQGVTFEELRNMPAEDLLKLRWDYSTITDNYTVTDSLGNHMLNGTANDVVYITGKVAGDASMFGAAISTAKYSDTMPVADYEAAVREAFGDLADRALALYPATGDNALPVANAMNLDMIRYSLMQDAQVKMTVFTKPAYIYTYTWPYAGLTNQGAFHSSDIAYWMGGLFTSEKTTWSDDDYALANAMSGYLVNIAKTGNPNGEGLPYWGPCTGPDSTYLAINSGSDIGSATLSAEKQALLADYSEWVATRVPEEKDPEQLPPNSCRINWSDSLADCAGVLTVNPADSSWTVSFSNNFGEYTLKGTYDADYVLTVTDDAGLGGFLELEPLQAVAGPAIPGILYGRDINWSDSLADCAGRLTIDPEDSTWTVNFSNNFGEYTLKGTYDADYALTVTDDGGLGGFLELEPLQAVAGPAIRSILYSRDLEWEDAMFDCTGTLTIDPATSEWTLDFSAGPHSYVISGTYDSDYVLTVIDDGGLGGFLDLPPIQAVAGPAILDMLGK